MSKDNEMILCTADICPHGTSSSLCEWCGYKVQVQHLRAQVEQLLREKETWGNEYSAIMIMKDQLAASEALAARYREALEEAYDWLCPHTEAAAQKKSHPDIRAWCCDCHNYLRSEADATLFERIDALLVAHQESSPQPEVTRGSK